MIPIELTLENFTCHVNSVIDFTQFTSAVIVGQGTNNTRRSNGVGKSKIFTGINYALFNQSSFNSIENVIRDTADKCKVTFIFQVENDTYKVVRSRGRKANSADIRLYKKNDLLWEDLTERTPSGTEKALLKIIKINYNTFMNSVHFGQSDLSGLALLSAGDRKKLLKEALQLHVYSQLEKITKKRISALTDDLTKAKAVLSTFDGLEERIAAAEAEVSKTEAEVLAYETDLAAEQVKVDQFDTELSAILDREKVLKIEHDTISQKVAELTAVANGLATSKNQSLTVRNDLKAEFQKKKNELIDAHSKLKEQLDKPLPDLQSLNKEQESLNKEIVEKTALVKSYQLKIRESNVNLPDGPQCETCLQTISDEHRDGCKAKAEEKIATLQKQISNTNTEIQFLMDKQKLLATQIKLAEQQLRDLDLVKRDVEGKEKELDIIKNKYQSFDKKFKEFEEQVKLKDIELEEWKVAQSVFNKDKLEEFTAISSKVSEIQRNRSRAQLDLKVKQDVVSKGKVTLGVITDRLAKSKEDLLKRAEQRKKLTETEDSFNLHSSVAQAFGSKGIPALIIHNMLDDLQIHANNTIAQIKPGLQLEFEIDKENSKGEQTDTLNIKYILNGREREYDQLSGAQKLVVTLGLRLGLSLVIQKSFGIDIKFLMLDEVDASLDEEGLDAFIELIRVIEKDFKVLVITHNNSLKSKFSHAILVEQDQNMNSTAKIVSSW